MSERTLRIESTLAAIGVIVSLLFVGWEIRQNTKVARAAAIQATGEQIIMFQTELATDADRVRIFDLLRSGTRYQDLSPEDRDRLSWIVSITIRIMENRYRQLKLGIIDEEDLGAYGGTSNPDWFRGELFMDYWTSRDQSGSWSPDFVEFFETKVLGIREPGSE